MHTHTHTHRLTVTHRLTKCARHTNMLLLAPTQKRNTYINMVKL